MHLFSKIFFFSNTNKDNRLKVQPNIVIDECNKWLKYEVDKWNILWENAIEKI